jgi:F-type H+-transporting ATPase subunit b
MATPARIRQRFFIGRVGGIRRFLELLRFRAQALANATREKQQAEADSKRKALEQQLDAKLAEAEKTIAATKSAAMGNVRSIATDATAAIVKRLTGTEPSGQAVTAAIAEVLKR